MADQTITADALQKACADLLPRLGVRHLELRCSHGDEPDAPVVWIAVARFAETLSPVPQVAAHLSPPQATYALLERLVDGGACLHCQRPTGITLDLHAPVPFVCWWTYDPELTVFRRGCS